LLHKIREDDIPVIYSEPDSNVIDGLRKYKNLDELLRNLPTKLAMIID